MAVVVSHAMRRYPTSPPSHCLGGESSYRRSSTNWNHREELSSSTESALSRSMRYADAWLYGSVRAPSGLLLAPALVLCNCSEYLNGTKQSSKKSPSACKKCKGTRLPFNNAAETLRGAAKFGTVRCYPTSAAAVPALKGGTVRVSSSTSSRPSILPQVDPYELMRRSRLSENGGAQFRARSKSPAKAYRNGYSTNKLPLVPVSPLRSVGPSPKVESAVDGRRLTSDYKEQTNGGRRSILECDINPYDLMAQDTGEEKKKDASIAVVGGQRVKVRPSGTDQEYEEVTPHQVIPPRQPPPSQIPKLKLQTNSLVKKQSPPKPAEPEPEVSPYKSILKKSTAFSESDYSYERTPSPSPRNSSQFYLPTPTRKKVQFAVEYHADVDVESKPNQELEDEVFETVQEATEDVPSGESGEYEDVEVCDEELLDYKSCLLRRSVSERYPQETPKVVFHDTMALRNRNQRKDSREVFATVTDLQRLDGVGSKSPQNSPSKVRPSNPPPPPPSPPKQEDPKPLVEESRKDEEVKPSVCEEVPPTAPPRKRSNSKQPSVIIIDTSSSSININSEKAIIDEIHKNAEPQNKTIVQIRATPTVHKIQIKNEFPESNNVQNVSVYDNAQRKTSIMINGDDCYSTINVNDDVPLYHSSVVVKDIGNEPFETRATRRSSSVYITSSTTEATASKQTAGDAIELRKPRSKSLDMAACEDLNQLLKNPVEAVKRNLVPHVCGKSDLQRIQRDKKRLNSFTISLLENPLLESSTDTNVATLLENSLLKLKNYESIAYDDREACSEHSSSTQYELMDAGSDCYTDHSNRSSVTEEELNARTKFYELLADSAIAEISESDDHHYETIRINSDPIYEEINPPPLPSNPPPSSIIDDLQLDKQFTTRSIFEGASKYDILSYLVDAKERGIVPEDSYNFGNSDVVVEEEDVKEITEPYNRVSHMSTVSDSSEDSSLVIHTSLTDDKASFQKSAEVERNDSGVGSETSKSSLSRFRSKTEASLNCEDCEGTIEPQAENEPLICRKCVKKRSERKEIITEIVETEEKYNRDLQIILEEFYQPMLVAGLLTPEQLSAIFLNVEELLENSQGLAERLRDAVEIAIEQGDEDLLTVNMGKLFLEASPTLHAFETYCIRQGPASLLLASLEKEKELLRIFLRVSQMENTMLRRMNLNSFLMVPVQRVTKYPLLLARLHKATPVHHETRDQLKEAQHKIELHLNHMNSETRDVPSKLWRRIGSNSGRRSSSEMDLVSIKLRKIAVDVLEWNHEEARFALEGKLLYTQPTDNNWRKGRTIKLMPINALLVTNGKSVMTTSRSDRVEENNLTFPKNSGVREAALLLVRDKNGRYSLLREPLYLDRCIVATDPAWQSYFEVQEVIGKDTFIFKAEDDELTKTWYRQMQHHAQGLGSWRKRRNALANIMINGMGLRS